MGVSNIPWQYLTMGSLWYNMITYTLKAEGGYKDFLYKGASYTGLQLCMQFIAAYYSAISLILIFLLASFKSSRNQESNHSIMVVLSELFAYSSIYGRIINSYCMLYNSLTLPLLLSSII